MDPWNVPLPDAIFGAGGAAWMTEPTASQTPPKQPITDL